jgi:hypothetical protein
MSISAKNLTQEAPRSPRVRTKGYALLARMADKGRAALNDTAGEYHFDCPLDNILFDFAGVKGADVKQQLASAATDEQIADWIDSHGKSKTEAEKKAWSDSLEAHSPSTNLEKKDWFAGECAKVGLKPESSTLFDYLEADDAASFKK